MEHILDIQLRGGSRVFHMWIAGVLLTLAIITRTFQIDQPAEVVFDEVHFGGFARKYLRHEFFMDVHPPLGKLIFAGIGALYNWDAEFKFKEIGDVFDASVPYIAMRVVPALMSAFMVPVSLY